MSKRLNTRETKLIVILLGLALIGILYAALAQPAISNSRPPNRTFSGTGTAVDVTPAQPQEPPSVPAEMFDDPFADGAAVADVGTAARVLSFQPAAPAAVGTPARVFLHEDYTPQALALVYDHPKYGRFTVTQQPVQMEEDVQRAALEQLAATCDPAKGCQGIWTMHDLVNGNRALVISAPPAMTGIIWIHKGGIRYELMAPSSSLSVATALVVANVFEAGS
jgi:hypothetical protein